MNPTERLVSLLSSLILIIVGGTGILTGLGFFGREERPIVRAVKSWVFEPQTGYDGPIMFTGYVLVLAVGIWLATVVLRGREIIDSVKMETESGQVEISLEALEDVITTLQDSIEGIRSVYPEILSSSGSVNIRVNLDVRGNVDVPRVVEKFKQQLDAQLSETFKIKDLETVSVRIKNVSNFQVKREEVEEEFKPGEDESEKVED